MSTCNNPLALCKSTIKEKFWMDDFTELYKNNNFVKFFPQYESSRVEQLNAITRFFIYFIIMSLIFNKSDEWLYIPIIGIVIVVIIYNINKKDILAKNKEFNRIMNIRRDKIKKQKEFEEMELQHDGDDESKLKLLDEEKPYEMEVGSIDSDGTMLFDKVTGNSLASAASDASINSLTSAGSLLSVNELEDYRRNTCRKPSKDNPFMNPDITEYNSGDPPGACNLDDDEIKDDIRVNFNHDLFRDVDELWERANSQRQFYTIPNTAIPNNQTEFAKWLYGNTENCKTDGQACLRYEDLRSAKYHVV